MLRAGRTRRIRTTGAGVAALAAAALVLAATPADTQAGGGSSPPPPATNPQVTEVDGMWGASLFSAQDKPGFWEQAGYHNNADPWLEQRFMPSE